MREKLRKVWEGFQELRKPETNTELLKESLNLLRMSFSLSYATSFAAFFVAFRSGEGYLYFIAAVLMFTSIFIGVSYLQTYFRYRKVVKGVMKNEH